MRTIRSIASLASVVAAAFDIFAVVLAARAQVACPGSGAGWVFSVTPYAWLPMVSTTYSYAGRRAGIGDYLSELNFALMVGGEAPTTPLHHYDRPSLCPRQYHHEQQPLLVGQLRSRSLFNPRDPQLSTGTRLATTVRSVAGGYTLLQG